MLEDRGEPNEQRMKLLKLGIGYLAVQAKLEENEYGDFFNEGAGNEGRDKAQRKESGVGGNQDNAGGDDSTSPGFFADEIAGRLPS